MEETQILASNSNDCSSGLCSLMKRWIFHNLFGQTSFLGLNLHHPIRVLPLHLHHYPNFEGCPIQILPQVEGVLDSQNEIESHDFHLQVYH